MSIVIEAHIPAESLLADEIDRIPSGTRVEFDGVVPVREVPLPYLRVRGEDPDGVADLVRECACVDRLELLDGNVDEHLYTVRWSDVPRFVDCLRDAEGALLRAVASDERWTVECRLPTEAAVTRFESACTDGEIDLSVTRIGRQGIGPRESPVTDEQRVALSRALAEGYFEVPRRTTLVDLADEFGVSDSAMSQRLRRGIRSVLHESDAVDELQ
ncbi:MAG: helix-turn-helix domain-containing protein [Haloferacaceae archaeon]